MSRESLPDIFDENLGRNGPLLPILHEVQDAFGCG